MVNGQWIWRKYSASFSTPSTQKKITDLSWTKTQLHTHFGIQKKKTFFSLSYDTSTTSDVHTL